jgi:transcriptional regulator with XRE-family HTH domain
MTTSLRDRYASNPIRIARESLGFGRPDFAGYLGLSNAAIFNVETGRASALPATWRPKIEALGLPFDDLASQYAAWRVPQGRG